MNQYGQDQMAKFATEVNRFPTGMANCGSTPAPIETIGSITQDSLNQMRDLVGLLTNSAITIIGSEPSPEGKQERPVDSLMGLAQELRGLIGLARYQASRIAGNL